MDTKRTGTKNKAVSEIDSETRANSHASSNLHHSESRHSVSGSSSHLSSDAKPKGRPKRSSHVEDKVTYPSLREGAIQEYLLHEIDPISAYQLAGSFQASSFLTECSKDQSLFRYLFTLKQIKFQGAPEIGDLVFLDMYGNQVALVHSFSARENRLLIFDEKAGIKVLPTWYCFGWFVK